jgi:CubicO group peptidase (beta-lactamase class C family)
MPIYIKSLLTFIVLGAALECVTAQTLPPEITGKIDSLFSQWNKTTSPGCAVGVVRNDSLIFSKGYGMANLEYNVPLTPETIFHMASVAKQFTAYSILLLERRGSLSLDDDIHKYLTWFPDLNERITIRNLLNHTSGIRDQWEMLATSGTRLDDVITQDQVIKILAKQQALNFKPGTDWSYSNSNFTLLAEIVRSVSGQSLRQFTDSAIFKPLGMSNTHFRDDYTGILPNRSYGYTSIDESKDHYANAILNYSTVGPAGLFTNVDDMSKWIMNFYANKLGSQKDIEELTEPVVVNGVKRRNYAKGIVADSLYGQKRYQHGGVDIGYQTFISVFPELKMGFIVFSNLGNTDAQRKNEQLAALFIKGSSPKRKDYSSRRDSALAIFADTQAIRKYAGAYIADDGTSFSFAVRDRKLYGITPNGKYHLLIGTGNDVYELFTDTTLYFRFSGAGSGQIVTDEYWPVGNHLHLEQYDTATKTDRQLTAYIGTYYCPELDCNYRIGLKDHHLFLSNAKYSDSPLVLYGDDHLLDNFWFMNHIHITRNAKKQITGFELNGNRVMHLKFVKTN